MTYEFNYLMEVLSYAAVGKSINAPKQTIDWNSLLFIADKQNVLPMLTYALNELNSAIIPENVRKMSYQNGRQLVIAAQVRKINVLSLISYFEKNGIEAIVLKGFSLSNYYYLKDTRISGDADIYIKKRDENTVINRMISLGFHVSRRQAISNHSECYSDSTGWVEIHTELYHKRATEIWFGNLENSQVIRDNYIVLNDENGNYKTLGYTDNVIFLSLHLIKHFIPERITLRQILDVSLFYFKNYEKIDTNRYWNVLKELHYDSLIATILSVAVEFCALPAEWSSLIHVQSSKEMEEALLNDIEDDDIHKYGKIDGRTKSGTKYSRIIGNDRIGELKYSQYIIKRKMNILISRAFPKLKNLQKRYPIIETHRILTPFLWFYHVFINAPANLIIRRKYKDNSRSDEQLIITKRMEMFRKLGMI